jgi:hypothetical protein
MDVWRRKNSSPLTSEPPSEPSGDVANAALIAAMSLSREINVLLGVANDSSDFRTKSVRLASAKQKLSELQDLVLQHPRMRITGLSEAQGGIARLEGDLLGFRYRTESDGAIWVFHAGFYLDTPLEELLFHGIVERGPSDRQSNISVGSSRSRWSLALPTLSEMGLGMDDPPVYVASAIGPIPAHGVPFLGFLMVFRKIIESGSTPSAIEAGLNVFSGRDEFTSAVFERLGPARAMMRQAGMVLVPGAPAADGAAVKDRPSRA